MTHTRHTHVLASLCFTDSLYSCILIARVQHSAQDSGLLSQVLGSLGSWSWVLGTVFIGSPFSGKWFTDCSCLQSEWYDKHFVKRSLWKRSQSINKLPTRKYTHVYSYCGNIAAAVMLVSFPDLHKRKEGLALASFPGLPPHRC